MARPILPAFFDNSAAVTDEWDLVIKVKHGDTLRRISAYAIGQCMDHDMGKLRAKIISLFKFSDDAELILTYTDEDGDQVTLDNDDELRDAIVHQRLNPLRINVQLKPNTSGSSETPQLETPQFQAPVNTQSTVELPKSVPEPVMNALSNLLSVAQKAVSSSPTFSQVAEVIKSEPLKSAISNLSKDVTKAASSSPTCGQLVEGFSKLGLSNAGQPSGSTSESLGGSSGASPHLMDLNIPVDPKVSNDPTLSSKTIPINPDPEPNGSGNAKKTWDMSFATPLNTDAATTVTASHFDGLTRQWNANKSPELEKEVGSPRQDGKSTATTETNFPGSSWFPASSWYPGSFVPQQQFPPLNGGSTSKQTPGQVSSPAQSGFGSHFGPPPFLPRHEQVHPQPLSGPKSSHFGHSGTSAYREVPFDELSYDVSDPFWTSPAFAPPYYPTTHGYNGNAQRTFHRGVQCDGCGMHPIVGPRYKSNVMEDYDLCNLCYLHVDNKLDYTQIVRSPQRAPKLLKDFHKHHLRYRTPSFKVLHGSGSRAPRAKLESSFIKDVTVIDGTVMPPSTHFTKIWRMLNNGTVAWPVGTQLLWVGGDKIGDRVSAQLEIAVNGLPVNNELDIAVDFTAPSRPGRYVSYWKMASPTGHKFGQRVWVLIQVDYSRPNSAAGVTNFTPDLNVPPESSNQDESEIIDVNAEPLDSGFPVTNLTGPSEELVNKTVVVDVPNSLLDATIDELPKTTPESVFSGSSSSSPLIDMPETTLVEKVAADRDSMEETLLKELEEMGFRQIDLNKEILRRNEYDLEQSVDDLCGFAEWDPLLSELHEMGFNDSELNKKVLIKNGGSIKRAVLDLIAGEKPE